MRRYPFPFARLNTVLLLVVILLLFVIFDRVRDPDLCFVQRGFDTGKTEHKTVSKDTTDNTKQAESTTNTNFKYVDNGRFILDNGKIAEKDSVQKDVMDWYYDPMCPACANLESFLGEHLNTLSAKMPIRYNPMNFFSADDKDFSTRASSLLLSIVEVRPGIAIDFFKGTINPEFQPTHEEALMPIEKYKEVFTKIGGTEDDWNKVLALEPEMVKEIKSALENADMTTLDKKSPTGQMVIPFLVIGDSEKAVDFTKSDKVVNEYLIELMDEYLKK